MFVLALKQDSKIDNSTIKYNMIWCNTFMIDAATTVLHCGNGLVLTINQNQLFLYEGGEDEP